jgi:sulfur carrier protein
MDTLLVNGKLQQWRQGQSISDLLQELNLNREGIAVAVNHMVIPKHQHQSHKIMADDQVEIIRAVGGG